MQKRRCLPWLLGAALLTMMLPTRAGRVFAQGAICGQFTDVPSSSALCPYILQAFLSNLTQGTSAATFSPSDPVARDQAATFVTRTMDLTLHRGTVRASIGKTWAPTSTSGGMATDVGGQVNDVVTDGTYLWFGRVDGTILKVNAADRRSIESWNLTSGVPKKLGMFGGQVWVADDQSRLHAFNPTNPPGAAALLFNANGTGLSGGSPSLAFDGTDVWLAGSGGPKIFVYPVNLSGGFSITTGGNIEGMVFDGMYMWVLLANSNLLKLSIPSPGTTAVNVVESLTLPGPVTDCRMLYDGNNIWIPVGGTPGTVYVVRPTLNLAALPSSIVATQAVPDVLVPYVAAFDGENVMIGGANNGTVALYKSTNATLIRTFNSGAVGVRGIASDGRTFNIGDGLGTRFFQF